MNFFKYQRSSDDELFRDTSRIFLRLSKFRSSLTGNV